MADNKMLHTKAEVLRETSKVEEGVIDAVVGSTSIIDRMGDVIDQAGWDVKNFLKNPVILWGHNVHEERPPIGKALKVWKGGSNKKNLMFQVKFDLQDNFAAEIFRKVKDGFINTVSVGFLPTEWEELDAKKGPIGGRKYTKQELLELSFVPVPANPEAIVALRSMHDKRFEPVELKDLYKDNPVDEEIKKVTDVLEEDKVDEDFIEEEETKEEVLKPYPNEHACRLANPADFQEGSFRRTKRSHQGKQYSVIMGKKKGEDSMSEQAYRYAKDTWTASEAGAHCRSHDGSFEAARDNQEEIETKDEPVVTNPPEKNPVEETPVTPPTEEKPVEPAKPAEDTSGTSSTVTPPEPPKEEKPVEDKPVEDKPVETSPTEVSTEETKPVEEKPTEEVTEESKRAIPYRDMGTAPESETWDGPGEMAKCDAEGLKAICAWYDENKEENKSSYKLPHHQGGEGADGHKAVWRGVAAAMAALIGARGGVDIPDEDKKAVYNHLAKHYKEFNKDVPDYKMVEDQVLSKLGEEIQALTLDREDKHVVRLVKKVIHIQKEQSRGYNQEQIRKALELIDLALSLYKKDSLKGGD